jgi:O-methyltransferase involved in polyketide biosynthesis
MQLREPTHHLTGVAETLMITLYARALAKPLRCLLAVGYSRIETQRPEPILSDRQSHQKL